MKTATIFKTILAAAFTLSVATVSATASAAADEKAAKATWKRNDCNKCHASSRDKKGPSLKKMAKELKEKAAKEKKEPVALAMEQMTKGLKVKLLDSGKEEEHKIIDTKDASEQKNLAEWILTH